MRIARIRLGSGDEVWARLDPEHSIELLDIEDLGREGRDLGPAGALTLVKPVTATSTVVCLLGNWKGRDGRDGPSFFVKPISSLIGDGEAIVLPGICRTVVYEPEIAAVIGRTCREVTPQEARAHVLGWTCVNDVTATDLGLNTNFPFLPGKSFDTFGVLGPVIETELDPDDTALRARINGRVVTDTVTSRMNWSTDEVVSWVSRFMTLRSGDLVCLGTPPQIEPIQAGDLVEVEVAGIGTLRNPVVAAG
ncbi:2-hydroxyhepta-2,4-diene-1,7-dioate isomerase [Streptomyces dioscori]|uniref:2-hydroxyhepta-2,4-diene-1,7-dioate isomerase n=1 Tax=Streptomyces dioscori TaxID=2109333 RepID=A0A2P8PYD3_9ACTN|nr:fumarylacetoacetate hydrolase family protein [Streptomyces dioscori]PSM39004.1 2-hydroxyhepta-2,4-diene-1,7-dioate isomerase [Streptomyces dioscori]